MLSFVFQKIRNKKWMIACLLLGNLLMVAIAAAAPLYTQAALQRALTRDLSDYMVETNNNPGTITMTTKYNYVEKYDMEKNTAAFQKASKGKDVLEQTLQTLGVPVELRITSYYKSSINAIPDILVDGGIDSLTIRLSGHSDVEQHLLIKKGRIFSTELDEKNTIEVLINERTFMSRDLMMNQEFELENLLDANGEPYRMRVVGIFTNSEEQDPYWVTSPNQWNNVFLMDYDLFAELLLDSQKPTESIEMNWFAILDYSEIKGHDAANTVAVLESYLQEAEAMGASAEVACLETVKAFLPENQKLTTTVWVLLLPVFVLLIAFVFMVSRQMLEMEQNEISVYKSRGANKGQIFTVYLLQSLCIAVVSMLGGIPLGVFICKVLGSSNAFLEFVNRSGLPVEISSTVVLFAGVAALFSVGTMVIPVFRYANVGIVDHKRQKNRAKKRPLWNMLFLDIILLGGSVYGLYQYNEQKEMLAQKIADGGSMDPLLYICSSLFMIGSALLILRIFPLLVRLIFQIGKRWWSPAMYTSFLRIVRTNNNQGFLMVFLIMTVALGIFSAHTARTINANAEDRIAYMAGSDIVLQEVWGDNKQELFNKNEANVLMLPSEDKITYVEPNYNNYLTLDGVENITKVLIEEGLSVSMKNGKVDNVTLMGIHTKEFGETAWFKESLLPQHYHAYLNAISQNASAILVSSNFRDTYGYQVGDVLYYTSKDHGSIRGIIYGFVDYWPSFAPYTVSLDSDGIYKQTENFLIVAHLSRLQSSWGVTPYQVWIEAEDSTRFIYDYATQTRTEYPVFRDAAAQLLELKNDPIYQGTNGILTVGFVCILMLCSVGFLIYWILSIQSRTLQFGIFRAMGMSMREIFTMLINEQFFITGISIAAGILVGMLTSKLFVPLVQMAYSSAEQVIPIEIVSQSSDYVRLFVVIGAVILICMVALGVLISKIKISQALKLGED